VIDGYRCRPLYSADNEDTRSELTALEITGDDTVIAIAAGGGRALSLLTAAPKRLIAIDRRADQLFNLELKAAALEAFDYEPFLAFLGIAPESNRLDQYEWLRKDLSPAARRYWDNRRRLIESGVFYAGRTETALVRFMSGLKRLGLMRWLEPFFQATSLEAQRALLDVQRVRVDRGLVWWKLFCHPLVVYLVSQDPGFLRSTEGSVGEYLVQRLIRYASLNLVRESFLLRLVYDGRLTPGSPLPVYITRDGFDAARKNVSRLEIHGGDLRDFAGRWRINERLKWSLSDVSCWMPEQRFHELLHLVTGVGAPGSRFCARHFAARHALPSNLVGSVRWLNDLCASLDDSDSSVIYRFEIGITRRFADDR
jgi:S-adenosylmethionine-diacylglycerol 3-amino-3-carboxypropyl transferase